MVYLQVWKTKKLQMREQHPLEVESSPINLIAWSQLINRIICYEKLINFNLREIKIVRFSGGYGVGITINGSRFLFALLHWRVWITFLSLRTRDKPFRQRDKQLLHVVSVLRTRLHERDRFFFGKFLRHSISYGDRIRMAPVIDVPGTLLC